MPSVTVQQAFELAIQHHQAGRLAEAEGIYRQILAAHPEHADALHLLGVIAHQVGRNDVAVSLIQQAISLTPNIAAFHSNLGEAHREMGQLEEAIAAYRRALELKPDYVEAHNNLGTALTAQGRLDEAITEYRRTLELKPDYADAHYNLGNVLRKTGQIDDAIAEYRAALQLKPDHAAADSNMGIALADKGDIIQAIAAYRRAIQSKPDYADAHNNLGAALTEQGQLDEAIAACRSALALKPDFAEALSNLGNALRDEGRIEEAVAAYRSALALKPGCADVHSNLLSGLFAMPDLDPQEMFREYRRWNEIHAEPLAKSILPHANNRDPDRRLRIGYVSRDFREHHPVAFFFENLLAQHDRGEAAVFCYSDLVRPDRVTARLRQCAGHWREIAGMQDAQVADLIRQDQIDILVDLAGHTTRNRLLVFARKPAPIQVTYLGYPDTTGMSAMDYRMTDVHADPPDAGGHLPTTDGLKPSLLAADPPGTTGHLHSEKLIRLPEVFACFRPAENSPPVGPLPAMARGCVTFASFHTVAKLNDRLLGWWAEILTGIRNSRLLMVAAAFNQASCRQRLADFFTSRGIGAGRLEFKGRQPVPQYLAMHNEVDLLLDSFPFTGHTMSCHALWMGVPVVTLAGGRHCSRMVASVLASLGLDELIARTPEEYVKIAGDLAGNLRRLAELRSTLRERMQSSPLTDAPRFARNVERAYRGIWRAWCMSPS